ncbi:NAD(P)-binding protein [Mycena leptocephala]|nr:NAD(P)-binding protein [Mycena leptocephala]
MMSSKSRKTVLITGCSAGGIGYELAKEYHSKGLRVIATARRLDALIDLAALGLETLQLDVTKIESVQAGRVHVESLTGGTLDILVNNAGQRKLFITYGNSKTEWFVPGYSVPATDINIDEVKGMFEVNLFGVMRMVQEFAPLLIASGDGRIVNIGSITGYINASKAALHSYGNTLRLELAPFKQIITGGVKSNVAHNRRLIQPSSLYAPIADIFAERRAARSQVGALATDVYAKQVVAQTLKRQVKAWFWAGSHSFTCWLIDTFAGRRGFDWLFSSMFGLSKLKSIIMKKKKQN